MIKGGKYGNTTLTGADFENKVDLVKIFASMQEYTLHSTSNKAGFKIFFKEQELGRILKKYEFYRFLEEYNIYWKKYLSKRLLPDTAIFLLVRDTLFIIEVKYQKVSGSVDEKLQTCDFKKRQYYKLVRSLNWKVEYVYILEGKWFQKSEYRDVLQYINDVNCHYLFDKIPLKWFGLPE